MWFHLTTGVICNSWDVHSVRQSRLALFTGFIHCRPYWSFSSRFPLLPPPTPSSSPTFRLLPLLLCVFFPLSRFLLLLRYLPSVLKPMRHPFVLGTLGHIPPMISHQHFPGPSGHPGCEASVRMSICDFSSIGLFQNLTHKVGRLVSVGPQYQYFGNRSHNQ